MHTQKNTHENNHKDKVYLSMYKQSNNMNMCNGDYIFHGTSFGNNLSIWAPNNITLLWVVVCYASTNL